MIIKNLRFRKFCLVLLPIVFASPSIGFGQGLSANFSESVVPTPPVAPAPTTIPGATPTQIPTQESCLRSENYLNERHGGRFGAEAGERAYGGGSAELQACVQSIYESFGSSGRAYQAADIKNMSFTCGSDTVVLTCWSGQHIDCERVLNGVNLEHVDVGYSGTPTQAQWDAINALNSASMKAENIIEGRCENASDRVQITDERGRVLDHNPWIDCGYDDHVAQNLDALIDEKCNLTQSYQEAFCTDPPFWIAWRPTPLSLVWNKSGSDESSLTTFPVDPQGRGRLFSWRGSADFPLVVFDPSHTGNVVDSSQLFGNSTFGKRFHNGYEALASLDADGNGKLESGELAPLALWFDENRDGVSDQGEVEPITQRGVVSLSTDYDSTDAVNGDLISENGFEVEANGERISGESIDWLSTSFESLAQAIGSSSATSERKQPKDAARPTLANVNAVEGLWKWRNNSNPKKSGIDGALLLRVRGSKVIGYSFTHTFLAPNPKHYKAHLSIEKLSGFLTRNSNGEVAIDFTTGSKHGNTTNHAVITPNGGLKGSTLISLASTKAPLRFQWTAKR